MAFVWTDRRGNAHELDTPALIIAERVAINAEIDAALADAVSAEVERNGPARVLIRSLNGRLLVLESDAERWNAHAEALTRADALELTSWIEEFNRSVWAMTIIGTLHDERMEALGSDPERSLQTLPMTDVQRVAVAYSALEPKPPADATRGEVDDWLQNDAILFRPLSDEGGWFEWLDGEGMMHRLASPLRIEYELAEISAELWSMLPVLGESDNYFDIAHAIARANAVIPRVFILQRDLERFERESKERENEEWASYKNMRSR